MCGWTQGWMDRWMDAARGAGTQKGFPFRLVLKDSPFPTLSSWHPGPPHTVWLPCPSTPVPGTLPGFHSPHRREIGVTHGSLEGSFLAQGVLSFLALSPSRGQLRVVYTSRLWVPELAITCKVVLWGCGWGSGDREQQALWGDLGAVRGAVPEGKASASGWGPRGEGRTGRGRGERGGRRKRRPQSRRPPAVPRAPEPRTWRHGRRRAGSPRPQLASPSRQAPPSRGPPEGPGRGAWAGRAEVPPRRRQQPGRRGLLAGLRAEWAAAAEQVRRAPLSRPGRPGGRRPRGLRSSVLCLAVSLLCHFSLVCLLCWLFPCPPVRFSRPSPCLPLSFRAGKFCLDFPPGGLFASTPHRSVGASAPCSAGPGASL